MSRRARLAVFAVAGPALGIVLLLGLHGLPAFGHFHGVYGELVNRLEPTERRATDIVTGLNFDIRAFDTLGEEFILFASVTGVALLLRHLRQDDQSLLNSELDEHRFAGASSAVRATSIVLLPIIIALGAYIVLHGALTPGGGFQGGVVLAAGPLAVLFAGRYFAMRRMAPHWALEVLDSSGAMAYALIGLGGLIFASVYLKNFLPLGTPGKLLSGGMMPLNSLAVGLEVTGAFLLMWTEYLDQGLIARREP